MDTKGKTTGAQPEDVKPHDPVKAKKVEDKLKKDDCTGQTDTTVNEMKARLKEVPHESAGTHHDKHAYDKKALKKN
jgi:hypothetical protein